MAEQEPTVEQLTVEKLLEKLDNLMKKQKASDQIRGSVIKLQEDLITGLKEELSIERRRGMVSFKSGLFGGLVIGTSICIIIDLVIAWVR
jgi:hypothetical protein